MKKLYNITSASGAKIGSLALKENGHGFIIFPGLEMSFEIEPDLSQCGEQVEETNLKFTIGAKE